MGISPQIESVYQWALLLRERATTVPVPQELLEEALKEFYLVLEELHTIDEELRHQNAKLASIYQALENERQRYRRLFDYAPEAALVTDHQGIIRQANRAASALLLKSQEVLVGKPLVVLIEADDRPGFWHLLAHPDHQQDWEVTLQRQSADAVAVTVSTTSIKDPQSHATTIFWSFKDITQRQQVTQQLRSAHDELVQRFTDRTAELAQAQAQLQKWAQRYQAEQPNSNHATSPESDAQP